MKNAQEEINKWYNHGVDYLEGTLGIELSILEKAIFRELVRDSVQRYNEINSPGARFCLGHEALHMFLYDCFRVPLPAEYPDEISNDWITDRWDFTERQGYDGYAKFWKKRQDEAHLI